MAHKKITLSFVAMFLLAGWSSNGDKSGDGGARFLRDECQRQMLSYIDEIARINREYDLIDMEVKFQKDLHIKGQKSTKNIEQLKYLMPHIREDSERLSDWLEDLKVLKEKRDFLKNEIEKLDRYPAYPGISIEKYLLAIDDEKKVIDYIGKRNKVNELLEEEKKEHVKRQKSTRQIAYLKAAMVRINDASVDMDMLDGKIELLRKEIRALKNAKDTRKARELQLSTICQIRLIDDVGSIKKAEYVLSMADYEKYDKPRLEERIRYLKNLKEMEKCQKLERDL